MNKFLKTVLSHLTAVIYGSLMFLILYTQIIKQNIMGNTITSTMEIKS